MAAAFPHHYAVTVELSEFEHAEGSLTTAAGSPVAVGPPPQFDGRPGHQSPEDLLLGAIAACHMTTLVALARRKRLPLSSYQAQALGTLEKTKEGLRFTALKLRVEATTTLGQEDELKRLIEVAEEYCIVSSALRLEVELEVVVPSAA